MSEEIIAWRDYFTTNGGRITVRWMKPVPDQNDWACEYVISVAGAPERRRRAYGVDSAQALLLAFEGTAVDLYTYPDGVYRFEPGDDLGLPTPRTIDDLVLARRKSTHGGARA